MNLPPASSRQPVREVWSRERLLHERSIAIGSVLEPSSLSSYTSAVQSYVTFCRAHDFPIDPTTDTISFYITYMCHHIKPKSVSSYLSGICNQLEVFYPEIRRNCSHPIVKRTLRGCKKIHKTVASRKRPLQRAELTLVFDDLNSSTSFDDQLFLALLYVGFLGLLRLGELVFPDKVDHQDFGKVIMRSSFTADDKHVEFVLPTHKADRTFEGNRILINSTDTRDDPVKLVRSYVNERDRRFPALPHLWVRSDGSVPTRSWFIRRLCHYFSDNVAGHSLRSDGATWLASLGVPDQLIQATGRWASESFKIYIRTHPVLLTALLFSQQPST